MDKAHVETVPRLEREKGHSYSICCLDFPIYTAALSAVGHKNDPDGHDRWRRR